MDKNQTNTVQIVQTHAAGTRRGKTVVSDQEMPIGTGRGNIIAYLRRSAEDRRGKPMEAQIETIRMYVNESLIPVMASASIAEKKIDALKRLREEGIREFFFDNGVSGTTHPEKREGFSKAIAFMREYENSHLVVYDVTRLARSVTVGSYIKDEVCNRLGVTLHLAQSRMVVEGANAEMFFTLNLQMASSERTAAITRIRSSLKHRDWDPRKGFGWTFEGAGCVPVKIEEEQFILSEIKDLYESSTEIWTAMQIAKHIQEKHGDRRLGRPSRIHPEQTSTEWKSTDISFLARKNNWKWGGGKTKDVDLPNDVFEAIREGKGPREFLKENENVMYDGVKVNLGTLRPYFPELFPEWKARALKFVRKWARDERHSVDDMTVNLTELVPRKEGWPRQTVWRIFQIARTLDEAEKRFVFRKNENNY